MTLYNIVLRLYSFAIWIVSFFNKKAKLWIDGRKNMSYEQFEESIWFHFASLGEFEQGRPVLEAVRKLYPDNKIVVTFFSPSGFEIRKNTTLANAVFYLPLDTAKNARRFIDAINPKLVIFTKYEYWYHFFNEIYKRKVPLYLISGIFRSEQIFFKWYGGFNRKILRLVTFFFVQDEQSKLLLQSIGIDNVTVSGDTRFDQVSANAGQPLSISLVNEFKNRHKLFIAGSTWPGDEKLLSSLISVHRHWRFIVAPHEVTEERIKKLIDMLPDGSTIKYSQLKVIDPQFSDKQVLVIDNVGMLSALYQYADIAYIGGGFGSGIHNTLEAAAFGLPVIFGPKYSKFKEANDLAGLEAGFSVANERELISITHKLIVDTAFYKAAKTAAVNYVKKHTGATGIIVNYISRKTF